MTGFASALLVRRGTPEWDAVLRATGILALAAIYPALRWPDVAVLAGFVCLTVFVSGPISMVLPAAFEPMLMVAGRLYHPLLVTLLAVAGNLYMDYVNYQGGPEDARTVPAESVLRGLVVRLEPDPVLDRVGARPDVAVFDAEIPVCHLPRARAPRLVLRDARPFDSRLHPSSRHMRGCGGRRRRRRGVAQGASRPAARRSRGGRRAGHGVTAKPRA